MKSPTSPHTSCARTTLKGCTLAIFEEDADAATLVARWLQRAGAAVLEASDLSEFRAHIVHADLCLLEPNFRPLSAFSFLGGGEASGRTIPPWGVLSVNQHPDARAYALDRGARFYLVKPVCAAELVEAAVMALMSPRSG